MNAIKLMYDILLEYDTGAIARVASGFDTQLVQRYRVDAVNGWLEVEAAFDVPDGTTRLEYHVDDRHVVETFDPVDQFRLEVEHFVDCLERGTRPRTDGYEAIENMRVIDGLSESAAKGSPVEL